jgi:hypothetical protein
MLQDVDQVGTASFVRSSPASIAAIYLRLGSLANVMRGPTDSSRIFCSAPAIVQRRCSWCAALHQSGTAADRPGTRGARGAGPHIMPLPPRQSADRPITSGRGNINRPPDRWYP